MSAVAGHDAATVSRIELDACYREHYDRLFAIALRLANGNTGFAEDLLHDAFIKLYERMETLGSPDNVGGWLYRVIVNGALHRMRRERSFWGRLTRAFQSADDDASPAADALFDQHESVAILHKCMKELPPQERVIVDMLLVENQTQLEIARTLSLSKGYVSKLVSKTCARLRQLGWQVSDDEA